MPDRTIENWWVQTYNNNVRLLAQQQKSRLRSLVDLEPNVKGKSHTWPLLGKTAASVISTPNGDTVYDGTAKSIRTAFMQDYAPPADLLSWEDLQKMLVEPRSRLVENQAAALARQLDQLVIDAAFGSAYDKEGGTATALPAAQKITEGGTVRFTLNKFLQAIEKLNAAEVPDEDRVICYGSKQLTDILLIQQFTSRDYTTEANLRAGNIVAFGGFTWIRIELLPVASSIRSCLVFQRGGIGLGQNYDLFAEVDKNVSKNNCWQVLSKMGAGAVRLEDVRVVELQAYEG